MTMIPVINHQNKWLTYNFASQYTTPQSGSHKLLYLSYLVTVETSKELQDILLHCSLTVAKTVIQEHWESIEVS